MLIPFISQLPDNQQQAWINRLNKLVPQANIVLAANINPNDYDACQLAIVANPKPDIVAQFKNLTWLQSLWAGVDGLAKEFLQADFEIVRLIDPFLAQTMAEAVLAWTLYLHRDMPSYSEQQQQNIWQLHPLVPATEKQVTFLLYVFVSPITLKRSPISSGIVNLRNSCDNFVCELISCRFILTTKSSRPHPKRKYT